MDASSDAALDHLNTLFQRQRKAFSFATAPSIAQRRETLKKLESLIASYKDRIVEAINADFGTRSSVETLSSEVALTITSSKHIRKNLHHWAKTRSVWNHSSIPGKAQLQYQPKGIVGIISPWNYPFQLAMVPVITALAAGNRVLLKPSEITPNTSDLMKRMLAEMFDETEVAVITGGPDVGEAFSALPFDHLFYTGSTRVGRLIAMAAAKNLTPVTLELGGKSPAIMLPDADMEKSATTLSFGKFYNAGQTCVAPDYLLVPEGKGKAWADALMGAVAESYEDLVTDTDYSGIISGQHFQRLTGMIDEARAGGATIIQPPHDTEAMQAARKLAPTIVLNPPETAAIMQEEIFGPILPIIEKPTTADMIDHVTARDHPLALYVYSRDNRAADEVLAKTTSGGVCVNGTILHLAVEDLPFGGVGKSGYGAYHGERGFKEFSHERSIFRLPGWLPAGLLAPPYSGLMKKFINWQIGK